MPKPGWIDAVPYAERKVPLAGDAGVAEGIGGSEQGVEWDHLIGVTVDEQDRRSSHCLSKFVLADQQPGIAEDRRRRGRPSQADMQRHHGTLAEADQRKATVVEAKAVQFVIQKGVESRTGRDGTRPTLVRVA